MKYLYPLALASLVLTLAACQEADNFTPGPESANTLGSAWFSSSYQSSYYYYDQPKDGDSIYLYVERANASQALDLPIVSEGDPEVIIPSSVHFAAGESSTYLAIASPQLQLSKPANFSLRIPDEYADVYAEKEGITRLSSSILWSTWTPVADTVLVVSAYGLFPRQGCNIENFLGDNVFRITNFLGSGNPLIFSLNTKLNTDNIRQNSGSITPLTNYYYGNANSDRIWDWSNDGNWTSWTPAGGSFEISYVEFGWGHYYYESSGGYDAIDFSVATPDTIKLEGNKYVYDADYWSKNVQMVYLYSTDSKKSNWDYLDFMICYRAE